MFQMKEQDKTPEDELSEVETGNLSEKEFRVILIKMIKELKKKMDAQSEKLEIFNKELENIKNNQTELKNTITEIKIFIYRLLYKNLMVTTNQKSIIDICTKKRKKSKHNTKGSHQITREENKILEIEWRKYKERLTRTQKN